jgi:hypothetical protein
MLSHQLLDIPASDSKEAWERVAQEARLLLEKIEIKRKESAELSVAAMRELLLPFIQLAGELPQDDEEGADLWTNIQAVFEFFGTIIQYTLCISLILDTITGDSNEDCNAQTYNWINISVGIGIGVMLALGEVLCHRIINIVNQNRNATLMQLATDKSTLTFTQKMALSIESISHVGEVASQYVILTRFIPNPTPFMRPLVYVGAGLVGIAGSLAETRTHLNSIRRFNSIFTRVKPVEPTETDTHAYHELNNNDDDTPTSNGYTPR